MSDLTLRMQAATKKTYAHNIFTVGEEKFLEKPFQSKAKQIMENILGVAPNTKSPEELQELISKRSDVDPFLIQVLQSMLL